MSKPALTTLWINYTSQASPISTETAALVAALRKKIDDLELELGRLKADRTKEVILPNGRRATTIDYGSSTESR